MNLTKQMLQMIFLLVLHMQVKLIFRVAPTVAYRGEGPNKKFFVGPFQQFRRANFARRAKSRWQKFAPK